MKLSELAKKASRLPDLEFEWGGVECWNVDVFDRQVKSVTDVINYIQALRARMEDYAHALAEITKAFNQLKEIILEAEVGEINNPPPPPDINGITRGR